MCECIATISCTHLMSRFDSAEPSTNSQRPLHLSPNLCVSAFSHSLVNCDSFFFSLCAQTRSFVRHCPSQWLHFTSRTGVCESCETCICLLQLIFVSPVLRARWRFRHKCIPLVSFSFFRHAHSSLNGTHHRLCRHRVSLFHSSMHRSFAFVIAARSTVILFARRER